VATVLAASAVLWRRPTPANLLRGSAAVLAAMVACGLASFGPWYHTWWIPIALLLGPGFLHRFAIAATLLAPGGYLLWTSLRTLDAPHQWLQLSMGLLVPLVVAIAAGRAASRWPAEPVAPR